MKRLSGIVVLLAGCASSSEYVPGPATTVASPVLSSSARPPAAEPMRPGRAAPVEPSRDVDDRADRAGRSVIWGSGGADLLPALGRLDCGIWDAHRALRGGSFVQWGRDRCDPTRDIALDRIMSDTLLSSEPSPSRDPGGWPRRPVSVDWQFR